MPSPPCLCPCRSLAADGRLVRFEVVVSDRPGGIAALTKLLAEVGCSIKDIYHERAWVDTDIASVRVKVRSRGPPSSTPSILGKERACGPPFRWQLRGSSGAPLPRRHHVPPLALTASSGHR
jgi:hypothetical protein